MKHDKDKKASLDARKCPDHTIGLQLVVALGLQVVYTWCTIGLVMVQAQFFVIFHFQFFFLSKIVIFVSSVFSIIFCMCNYLSFLVAAVFQLKRTLTPNMKHCRTTTRINKTNVEQILKIIETCVCNKCEP
ncbi:MAG: hypothetical protein ACKPKO_00385 [Candidatus Fonsibacter sp.]